MRATVPAITKGAGDMPRKRGRSGRRYTAQLKLLKTLWARREFWRQGTRAGISIPSDVDELLSLADRVYMEGGGWRTAEGQLDARLSEQITIFESRSSARPASRLSNASWYASSWERDLRAVLKALPCSAITRLRRWVAQGADPNRLAALIASSAAFGRPSAKQRSHSSL